MLQKAAVFKLFLFIIVLLIFNLSIERSVQYDFSKASSAAESILAQHLHDIKRKREEYGEPQVDIWQGDAIVIFRSLKDLEEEIIVSLGRDGSVTLSLGAPPKNLLGKILEH